MKTFKFNGNEYEYFNHEYNSTMSNERCIEIPIVHSFYLGSVLEVGRVLHHYFPNYDHTVVDKTEEGGIVQDICEYTPAAKFDTVISISTLEHIGWDDSNKERTAVQALERIQSLMLAPDGKIVATIPMGYNKTLDNVLRVYKLFDEQYCMVRIGDAEWEQRDELVFGTYPHRNGGANSLLIGITKGE